MAPDPIDHRSSKACKADGRRIGIKKSLVERIPEKPIIRLGLEEPQQNEADAINRDGVAQGVLHASTADPRFQPRKWLVSQAKDHRLQMLDVSRKILKFLVLLWNIAVASQRGTPKAVDKLAAFAQLLKPIASLGIEGNSALEFASFGFLQHEFRPRARCEQGLAHISNRHSRQSNP